MNEPRPATISALPCDRRSIVAKLWNTRTGSAELRTVTALVSRMRLVRTAAGAGMTAGAGAGKFSRWGFPMPNTARPNRYPALDCLIRLGEGPEAVSARLGFAIA